MAQESFTASVEEQVFEKMEKKLWSVPAMLTERLVNGAFPMFFRVVNKALPDRGIVPTSVVGKVIVGGVNWATGAGTPTPVPSSVATRGDWGSLLANLIVPVSGPELRGLKV